MATSGDRGFGGPEQQSSRMSSATGGGQSSRGEEGTASGMASAVKEKAQELASTVTSRAGEAWDTTRQTAQQAASTVVSGAEGAWDEVSSLMRRYPVASLCVGICIGFLLSQLIRNQGMHASRTRPWES
jgi:ElaB/YqjD/DUF883 family membrane-anchored ribosome-binding protein